MSDTPSSDPNENPSTPPLTPTTEERDQVTVVPPAPEKPKDDGRKPLGPFVFGKRLGFFITAVPLLVYLIGNATTGWLEDSRVHTCVNAQAMQAKAWIERSKEQIQNDFGGTPGEAERVTNELNIVALEDMIDPNSEEGYETEDLEKLLVPIRETSKDEFSAKAELRQALDVLLEMKELEHDHKNREVLALSHRLKTDGLDLDLDEEKNTTDSATSTDWFPPDQTWYPAMYTIVIGITAVLMLLAFPGYFKAPFKLTIWSVIVGVVGIFVWIGLVELDRNFLHVGEMMGFGSRAAFNPFEELKSNQAWMYQFLAIRFAGLVLVVPFIEEFFIRGWLMRYIDDPDWDQMPLADHDWKAVLGVVVYAVAGHPAELLAAAVWFSMVTWLFLKTKSIWDCVLAHAITNLLLGVYVIYTDSWHLW